MAETTADVRRDIEMTRERMSDTLAQLENKLNVMQIVRDHPWPALAVAVGAGVALSGSRADVKAAAATVAATQGTSSRVGTLLDDVVANLVTGLNQAFQSRLEGWVEELKGAIGAPQQGGSQRGSQAGSQQRSYGTGATSGAQGTGAMSGAQSGGQESSGMRSPGTMGQSGSWAPQGTEAPRAD